MFVDVFKVSKNSYHARMMKYIWNLNHYDFSHMCPYFWLTIFNHFAILVVFPIRMLGKLLKFLYKVIMNFLEAMVSMVDDYLEKMQEEAAIRKIEYYKEHPEEFFEVKKKEKKIIYK